jgi:phospholipid/cholesterol/gamma-HCH transport system substrate-binding protein
MPRERSAVKVGLLVLAGLVVLAVTIFLVGERQFLFARKNRYFVELENVSNLTVGNPVQLNGVAVGKVEQIVLPEDLGPTVRVWITIDRQYQQRLRKDSLARIQTLGLLGDKYIAINSGDPEQPMVEPGGEIAAAPATEIDQLLASGGDVVDNLVVAASSLSNILGRMERGEGLLGALVAERGDGQNLNQTVTAILTDLRDVLHDVKSGEGSLGRLLYDDALAVELEGAIAELQRLTTAMNEGDGLLPALLADTELRDHFTSSLENLDTTSAELEKLVADLGSGEGLLPRLMKDEALADELTTDLRGLLDQLHQVGAKLNQGEGTASQLINDPSVYEAISDILVGVNESRMLRWLIRNRQKAGIRERYDEAIESQGGEEEPPKGSASDRPPREATPAPQGP